MGPTGAEAAVRDTIRAEGPITFARFMEVALLAPGVGYYRAGGGPGEAGDYVTAPRVHPAFGSLLALQLRDVWERLGRPSTFTAVEAGAGDGLLAGDVVSFARALDPRFAGSLRYAAVDLEPPPRDPLPEQVQWLRASGLPLSGLVGCVLANELLDTLPVHRFQVHEGRPLELYVTLRGGSLVQEPDEPSTPELERYLREQEVELPEGYAGEVGLASERWMGEAAGALGRGVVLLVDYGATARELYRPDRRGGTLRCYYRQARAGSPLQRIGRQDVTAHVNLSQMARTAKRHGLRELGLARQRDFLQNLGFEVLLRRLERGGRPSAEREANRTALRELVKPGGMGDFWVLALGKGVDGPLGGFDGSRALADRLERRAGEVPLPLLDGARVRLLEGRAPAGSTTFPLDSLWGLGEE